jgi:hypothetical protein
LVSPPSGSMPGARNRRLQRPGRDLPSGAKISNEGKFQRQMFRIHPESQSSQVDLNAFLPADQQPRHAEEVELTAGAAGGFAIMGRLR